MRLPIRPAVAASPDYPFTPLDAPIKLDQNEAPEDVPASLKALALERLATMPWHRYPDLNAEGLAASIAAHEGWTAAGVVPATGSNVLIAQLVALAGLGAHVITVAPAFALYALDARLLAAALVEVPLRADLTTDVDALLGALHARRRTSPDAGGVVFLPRPHAPAGSLVTLDDLERLARASEGWLLVVDEAYHHFAPDDATALARRHPHVVLLRTMSKGWGLAGLRLGWALASDEVARQLRKLSPPFGVSVVQTVCAQVMLEQPALLRERIARIVAERERMAAALAAHPRWHAYPSAAHFLLVRTPDAARAHAALRAAGVLVRRQDGLPGLAGCLRVTVGTPAENDAFLAAARDAG
ncbi:MAG: histidinol-phosphate transaminase [Burkholderiales bacterium]|jgi:histidinol-phosphate aminotransferase